MANPQKNRAHHEALRRRCANFSSLLGIADALKGRHV
jgi:hypothetical protein